MKTSSFVLMLALFFPTISEAKNPPIRFTGSPLVRTLIQQAADEFKKKDPKIRIEFVNTDAAITLDELVAKKVDAVMLARTLNSEEVNRYARNNFHSIIIARDAIMPVVSFEIFMSGIKSLTFQDLVRIYSGEITNWKKVGGPDQAIYVLDLVEGSSTRAVFMQTIFEDDSPLTTGVKKVLPSDQAVQAEVSQSSRAVAYLSSAWTSQKVRGVGIRTNTGVVYPTTDNILSGEYPLSRNLQVVVLGEPRGDLKKFMNFVLGPDGIQLINDLKFIPAVRY